MSILRNSAKCTACGEEIESGHRHAFVVHYCKVEPTPEKVWQGEGKDMKLVLSGKMTWRFAVDGGHAYLRRAGGGFIDTSESDE